MGHSTTDLESPSPPCLVGVADTVGRMVGAVPTTRRPAGAVRVCWCTAIKIGSEVLELRLGCSRTLPFVGQLKRL